MNPRKKFRLKLRSRTLVLGERTLVMGVLNVTPDSFSDGGKYDEPELAIEHALAMERAGADLLDIGGESTRPGSESTIGFARIGSHPARPGRLARPAQDSHIGGYSPVRGCGTRGSRRRRDHQRCFGIEERCAHRRSGGEAWRAAHSDAHARRAWNDAARAVRYET